jgi:hypothetical protein
VRVTVFASAYDNAPRELEMSWAELCQAPTSVVADKRQARAFALARFDGPRGNRFVTEFAGLVLDFDDIPNDTLKYTVGLIAQYQAWVYTTYSHPRSEGTRLRVVLPYPSPVPPGRQEHVVKAFSAYFGFPNDPKANPLGLFFLPARAPDDPEPTQATFNGPLLDPWRLPDSLDVSQAMMRTLAQKLRRKPGGQNATMATALQAVADGVSFAEHGDRDNMAWRLACLLCREFPALDPDRVAVRFAQSIQDMGPDAPDMRDKLRRAASQHTAEFDATQLRQREYYARYDMADRLGHLTTTELERLGNPHKNHGLILRANRSFFFPTLNGYSGPYQADAEDQAHRDLSVMPGIELYYPSGEAKPMPVLMNEAGKGIESIVFSLRAQRASYDFGTGTLTMAPTPRRPIEPRPSAWTDAWLTAAFGDQKHMVESWLAWLPDLTVPLAMLFIHGPPDTGKDLFATCISRLWGLDGPCRAQEILGTHFNDALLRNPLVWANEYWPREGNKPVIEPFKDLISADRIPLRRKFLDNATIQGYCRLFATANDPSILLTGWTQTPEAAQALAERVLRVAILEDSAQYLRPFSGTWLKDYVARDEFLGHVLSLPRPVSMGRFQVKPPNKIFEMDLVTSSEWGSHLCQWIVGYLQRRIPGRAGAPVRCVDGIVYAHAGMLFANWHMIGDVPRPTSARFLSDILSPFFLGRKQFGELKYREVALDKLIHWATSREVATAEQINEWVTAPEGPILRMVKA